MRVLAHLLVLLAILIPANGFAGTVDNNGQDQETIVDELLSALDTILDDWLRFHIGIVDDDVIEGELPSLDGGTGPSDSPHVAERADGGWEHIDH